MVELNETQIKELLVLTSDIFEQPYVGNLDNPYSKCRFCESYNDHRLDCPLTQYENILGVTNDR